MRISYLLDRPELGGGPRVVFLHAALLAQAGHDVTVAAHGVEPAWSGHQVGYVDLAAGGSLPAQQDLTIATWWTTIERALASDARAVAHFCQGFELDLDHLASDADAIRAAYARPLPALVVSPHLAERLAGEFGRESKLAPPPTTLSARHRWRFARIRTPGIALCGIFEAPVKGVKTGLAALRLLAERGAKPQLTRVSALPLSHDELSLFRAARYFEAVAPEAARAAIGSADLLLFPSTSAEGFGLPLLEAMSLGVPAVASRTPGTEFMTDGGSGARLVPTGDAAAFAEAAADLLGSARRWRRQRAAGLLAARRFSPRIVSGELEAAVGWAATAGRAGRG